MSTAAIDTDDAYPPAVADLLPLSSTPAVGPRPGIAPAAAPGPPRRLCVVDHHMTGPSVPRVPSPASDVMAGHLHGWLYHLQGVDPTTRVPVDPEQQTAPFAAWLIGDGHPSRRPGQLSVRVCWYSEDAAHRSVAALARNPTAILGSQPYALAGISPVTRQPVHASDLLARDEDARLVRLHTISPVCFRNHTRWHCSLDGGTVLRSAISQWLRIWPGSLPDGMESVQLGAVDLARQLAWLGYIGVSACEIRTEMTHRGKVETMALRGWVEWDMYGLDRPTRRRIVLALLRGAELYGLGSRCAYGLGAVRVEVLR